jgi:hypothetical protein
LLIFRLEEKVSQLSSSQHHTNSEETGFDFLATDKERKTEKERKGMNKATHPSSVSFPFSDALHSRIMELESELESSTETHNLKIKELQVFAPFF